VVMGSPAKVVRAINDVDRQRIQEGVDFYVHNQRRFAERMKLQSD
jgi:carbonic anhydrase/acetyltransferase-like protein (isoleucine patch superfamily)